LSTSKGKKTLDSNYHGPLIKIYQQCMDTV